LSAGLELNSGKTKEKPFLSKEESRTFKFSKKIQVRGVLHVDFYV